MNAFRSRGKAVGDYPGVDPGFTTNNVLAKSNNKSLRAIKSRFAAQ